jgi:hypothetical protein
VRGTASYALAHALDDPLAPPPVVEERDVLLPRQTDQHHQAVAEGEVEQPPRRHRVDAHGVHPRRGHLREVRLDNRLRGEVAAVIVRPEGAVGDAAEIDPLVAALEELPVGAHTRRRRGVRVRRGAPGRRADRGHAHALSRHAWLVRAFAVISVFGVSFESVHGGRMLSLRLFAPWSAG